MSGVETLVLAKDICGYPKALIYRLLVDYIDYAIQVLQRGGYVRLPTIGTLKVKRMRSRNRYDINKKANVRCGAKKIIRIVPSSQLKDIYGVGDGLGRKSRGANNESAQIIAELNNIEVEDVRVCLRAWGDAAALVFAARGRLVIPKLGTIRVTEGKLRWMNDVRTSKRKVHQRLLISFRIQERLRSILM
jgi:nucleoid DNA-binding protein